MIEEFAQTLDAFEIDGDPDMTRIVLLARRAPGHPSALESFARTHRVTAARPQPSPVDLLASSGGGGGEQWEERPSKVEDVFER
jgi:hypothetical protein